MRALYALGVGAVAVAGAACGSSTAPNAGPVGGAKATIEAVGTAAVCSSGGYGGGMTCGHFFFTPSPDTAAAGTVTIKYDDIPHQVQFDTGPSMVGVNLPQGQNTSQPITVVAGTYTYHCNIHTYMHGTLIVH